MRLFLCVTSKFGGILFCFNGWGITEKKKSLHWSMTY